MLDVDLKARYVSTEELLHALGIRLQSNVHTNQVSFGLSQFSVITPWWDRSYDLALIVGTFLFFLAGLRSPIACSLLGGGSPSQNSG